MQIILAGYSSMFIMINDQVTVENLLKGIIIASDNDVFAWQKELLGPRLISQI